MNYRYVGIGGREKMVMEYGVKFTVKKCVLTERRGGNQDLASTVQGW